MTLNTTKDNVIIIKTAQDIEIELHGDSETITITCNGDCFDFGIGKDDRLVCDGASLRLALIKFNQ